MHRKSARREARRSPRRKNAKHIVLSGRQIRRLQPFGQFGLQHIGRLQQPQKRLLLGQPIRFPLAFGDGLHWRTSGVRHTRIIVVITDDVNTGNGVRVSAESSGSPFPISPLDVHPAAYENAGKENACFTWVDRISRRREELAGAVKAGLRELLDLPSGRDAVTFEGGNYPVFDRVVVDLTAARSDLDRIPPEPRRRGNPSRECLRFDWKSKAIHFT